MNKNKTIFITSLDGDVLVRELDITDIDVWFTGSGSISNDDHNIHIASEGRHVEVLLPRGEYNGLSFQNVNGNIEIDAPNICFGKVFFLNIKGNIDGRVKYRQIMTEDIRGSNNLNEEHRTSLPHLCVSESIDRDTVINDRTISKDWKW